MSGVVTDVQNLWPFLEPDWVFSGSPGPIIFIGWINSVTIPCFNKEISLGASGNPELQCLGRSSPD